MKKVFEGYFATQVGYESGPTLMKWNSKFKFNKKIARWLEGVSWCDNRMFTTDMHPFLRAQYGKESGVEMSKYIAKKFPENIKCWQKEKGKNYVVLKESFFEDVKLFDLNNKEGKVTIEIKKGRN